EKDVQGYASAGDLPSPRCANPIRAPFPVQISGWHATSDGSRPVNLRISSRFAGSSTCTQIASAPMVSEGNALATPSQKKTRAQAYFTYFIQFASPCRNV